eukprot:2428521-Prymnesium_polylepis.1
MFTTLFSFQVLVFVVLMLVFAFIFSIGLHIAFGNDVESYALLGDAFLSVYAAFFGDSDRGEMMTADSNTDSSVMG